MNDSTFIPNNATNNSGYDYCKYDEPESDLVREVKRITAILLITLGLAGNIFVIVLAVKYTPRKNLHHLIINMAVSDVFFPLINSVLAINVLSNGKLRLTYPDGILGDILCKASTFSRYVSLTVSLVTLLIISIERFRVTGKTLQRSRPHTVRQRVLIVGVSWLIPMIMRANVLYDSTALREYGICFSMSTINDSQHYIAIITEIFIIIIFIFMVFVFSILTIKRLSRNHAIHSHLNQEQRKARVRQTQSAVRMVLASVLLYTCCWFPLILHEFVHVIRGIFNLWEIYQVCMDWRSGSFAFIVYVFLPLFNSCFSPCIYIIFLTDFREAAKKVLCTKTNRRENRRNSIELQQMEHRPSIETEERRGRRNANEEK